MNAAGPMLVGAGILIAGAGATSSPLLVAAGVLIAAAGADLSSRP